MVDSGRSVATRASFISGLRVSSWIWSGGAAVRVSRMGRRKICEFVRFWLLLLFVVVGTDTGPDIMLGGRRTALVSSSLVVRGLCSLSDVP